MSLSIRIRTLLTMNLLVVGLAGAFGWLAARVAGDVVEERLAREVLHNTSAFLRERHLPFNDAVMRDLRRIFGVEFAVLHRADLSVLATSLPETARDALAAWRAADGPPHDLTWGRQRFRAQACDVYTDTTPPVALRFVAFVPESYFADARRKAAGTVAAFTVPGLLLATVLAFLFSWTLTRPLSALAQDMDRRAAQAVSRRPPADAPGMVPEFAADAGQALAPEPAMDRHGRRLPREIAQLSDSFHHLLAELRTAQERLAESERLATLGRLAATVAHELKNPLSGIQMNLRVLQDELAQRQITDPSLELIRHEIERMDLYLQELMLLARPAGGSGAGAAERRGPRAPVQVADLAQSVLALLAARCAHAGVSIETDLAVVPTVPANPAQVRQVILNLLVNALEAMPAGGTVRLTVAAVATDAGPAWIRCAVTDSGGGVRVPPGTDIFAPFTSSKAGSAGLGLYVCRRIVDGHAGRIGYENTGSGARFWFELPA